MLQTAENALQSFYIKVLQSHPGIIQWAVITNVLKLLYEGHVHMSLLLLLLSTDIDMSQHLIPHNRDCSVYITWF